MLARLEERNEKLQKDTEEFRKQKAEHTAKWQKQQYQNDIEQFQKYQKKKQLQSLANNQQSLEVEQLLRKFEQRLNARDANREAINKERVERIRQFVAETDKKINDLREERSPTKVPVAAFRLSEQLTQKLEKNEKRRKRETSEKVSGIKERL